MTQKKGDNMHNSKSSYDLTANGSRWRVEMRSRKEHEGQKAWILQNGREVACVNGNEIKLKKHDLGFKISSIPEEVIDKALEMQNLFGAIICCGCDNCKN